MLQMIDGLYFSLGGSILPICFRCSELYHNGLISPTVEIFKHRALGVLGIEDFGVFKS